VEVPLAVCCCTSAACAAAGKFNFTRRASAGPHVIAAGADVETEISLVAGNSFLNFRTPDNLLRFLATMKSRSRSVLTILLGLMTFSSGATEQTPDLKLAVQRAEDSTLWFDIRELDVEGRGWTDTKSFYDRLPAKAEGKVREPVWNLSHHSAGMCVRFVTDATTLQARWVLTNPWLYLPNMAANGVSGLDLYVKTGNGQWRWLAVGQPSAQTNTIKLADKLIPGKREYLLYLPLHNGVQSLEIGIPEGTTLAKAGPWGAGERKPIVFYGTSIQHGIAASRPGMVHSAILGRHLHWPTINLGFSGNGKMEPEMADLLAELDPAVYVLDCLPNMVASEIKERVEPLVQKLRAAHPATPIVLVEDRTLQDSFLIQGRMEYYHLKDRAELKAACERLKQSGVGQLYYLEGEHLLGDDGEGTTDGSHPNDLGFMRQAEVFEKVLKPMLEQAWKSEAGRK
jgi:lysophospholipase L1-like esterase